MTSRIKDGKAPNVALTVKERSAEIIQIIIGNTDKFTPNFFIKIISNAPNRNPTSIIITRLYVNIMMRSNHSKY